MSSSAPALGQLLDSTEERAFRQVSLWGAVRSEFIKLSRMRANYVMAAAGVVLFAFVVVVLIAAPHQAELLKSSPRQFWNRLLDVYVGVFQTGSGILLLIAAARLSGQEYSLGTVRVALARGEARIQFWAAKLLVLALLALVLLAGFSLLAGAGTMLIYHALAGSTAPLTSLPGVTWTDLRVCFEVQFLSLAIVILVGTAAALLGRSVGFAVGAALALFPADNFGTIIMSLLARLTNNQGYSWATAYFLGPNLNVAVNRLEPDHATQPAFIPPLVINHLDQTHVLLVIACWAVALLIVPLVLLLRRDVLE